MIQAAHGDRAWSVIHSGRSNTDYLQSHLCVCVCGHERGVLLNSFVTWNKRNTKVDAISFLSLGAGDKVCAGPSDCRAFKQDLRHEGCWEQFPCTPPVRVCTAIIDHGGRMETVCSSLTSKRGSWEVSEEVLSVCLSVCPGVCPHVASTQPVSCLLFFYLQTGNVWVILTTQTSFEGRLQSSSCIWWFSLNST